MRTATLDLNSRGSFVDDLNSKPGIVMCRDALLHRSHEIQPAFFDSEKKAFTQLFFHLFFLLFVETVRGTVDLGSPLAQAPGFRARSGSGNRAQAPETALRLRDLRSA